MTVSSFTRKQLRATLTLGLPGALFQNTNSNTLIVDGLRIMAQIEAVQSVPNSLDLKIYGMLASDMNALTISWAKKPSGDNPENIVPQNVVVLEANDGSGWVQVFSGTFIEAMPEYRGAPNVYFHIVAITGYNNQLNPASPLSFPGAFDVAGAAQTIVSAMGFSFENNGVSISLAGAYLPGTLFDQLNALCVAAGIVYYIQGTTIAICKNDGARSNIPLVVLNKDSGLMGYPVIERFGITVDCLFNPGVTNGGNIEVQSDIPAANGTWTPFKYSHSLSALMPDGPWLSVVSMLPRA